MPKTKTKAASKKSKSDAKATKKKAGTPTDPSIALAQTEGTKVWRSSDYRHGKPGGIGILAAPLPTAPGSPTKYSIVFTDYTTSASGISSKIAKLKPSGDWIEVPKPDPQDLADSKDFTIKGEVSVQHTMDGRFLRIRVEYGDPLPRREIGFIFAL